MLIFNDLRPEFNISDFSGVVFWHSKKPNFTDLENWKKRITFASVLDTKRNQIVCYLVCWAERPNCISGKHFLFSEPDTQVLGEAWRPPHFGIQPPQRGHTAPTEGHTRPYNITIKPNFTMNNGYVSVPREFLTAFNGGANVFLQRARHTSTCYKWPTMAPNQLKE